VPDDECFVTEYYDWTDYLYFTQFPEECDKDTMEAIKESLSKNHNIEDCDTPQIILDRIEPKWVTNLTIKESYTVEHKIYGNVVYETDDLEDAKAEVQAMGPRSYIIRDDKGFEVKTKSIPLYIYRGESANTLSKKTGQAPSGLFFSNKRSSVTGWGDVTKYSLSNDAKIFEYESSDAYCNDFNLYDKTYPEFKKYFGMYGDIESLSQFTKLTKEQQNKINDRVEKYAGNNFCWYDYWSWCLQLAAKIDLEAKGYDGVKWLKEDFGNAIQYQIWNLSVIKKYERKLTEGVSDTYDSLLDYISTTDEIPTGPAYILPNGKFISILENNNDIHANLFYDFLLDNDLKYDCDYYMRVIEHDYNWLRVNDGLSEEEERCYVSLNDSKLSSAQYDSLLRWLDYVSKHQAYVQVFINNDKNSYVKYDLHEYIPDDIIKRIKRYYSSGELYEQVLDEVYPKKGESKEDFISRFMSVTKDEYPSQKQRLAVAYSYWNRRNKKESIQESDEKTLKLPDDINSYYLSKYYPNYHKELVSLKDVLQDTDNLHDDSMKTRRTEIWGEDPELYRYDINKDYYGSRLEPIRLAKINNKFIVLDGNHRLRALSNSDYDNIEALVRNK